MKNSKKWMIKVLIVFLALNIWMNGANLFMSAHASATATVNAEEPLDIPAPVIDPALTGQWGYHDEYGVEIVFRFEEEGTGYYFANGMNLPIASYVATTEPYTEYEEDGYLITVYFGEATFVFGDESITITMSPMEYGYIVSENTLRIIWARDIADHYTDLTREPISE